MVLPPSPAIMAVGRPHINSAFEPQATRRDSMLSDYRLAHPAAYHRHGEVVGLIEYIIFAQPCARRRVCGWRVTIGNGVEYGLAFFLCVSPDIIEVGAAADEGPR